MMFKARILVPKGTKRSYKPPTFYFFSPTQPPTFFYLSAVTTDVCMLTACWIYRLSNLIPCMMSNSVLYYPVYTYQMILLFIYLVT